MYKLTPNVAKHISNKATNRDIKILEKIEKKIYKASGKGKRSIKIPVRMFDNDFYPYHYFDDYWCKELLDRGFDIRLETYRHFFFISIQYHIISW